MGMALHLRNRQMPGTRQFFDPVMPGVALSFPAVGAFLASRRPANPIGWLLCAGALVAGAFFAEQYATYTLITDAGAGPGGQWMAWLGTWLWIPGYLLAWTLLPLLLPDGRPPSPRWWPVVWMATAVVVTSTVLAALTPDSVNSPALRNPVGVDGVPPIAGALEAFTVLVLGPICVLGLVSRYRRLDSRGREQLRWVVGALAVAAVVPVAAAVQVVLTRSPVPLVLYQALGLVTLVAVPVSLVAAIARRGLLDLNPDLDVMVNTTLAVGALAVLALAVYWGVVGTLEAFMSGEPGLGPSVAGVLAVAVVVRALRRRLQRVVDRMLYRKRRYDQKVVTALDECFRSTLGADAVLPAIVQTVATGLKLPYVAMTVGQGDVAVAASAYGEPRDDATVLPLVHQGDIVGTLTLAPRSVDEPFDAADRRLLDDIAGQTSVVAYALCLTADLQRSRERLVTAQEEERRRLRRDLHDGLQPALAGIGLGLEAVRNILGPGNTATELVGRLGSELQTASGDLRRLVYNLRPPALDELGLVGALRQQAANYALAPDGPDVVVRAPDDLHGLPAAVEVAAYRIGQEALENVRKHSHGRRCEVVVSVQDGQLRLEVRDDGAGIEAGHALGVGLVAMRERAAAVGGSCSVESLPGQGTSVRAQFPVGER